MIAEKPIAGFSRSFWTFLPGAENLYDIGLYIFVLLYNLYLLDLGYREDFIGWVSSAMSIGGIAGCLPAAAISRRLGLKQTLIFGSAGVAVLLHAANRNSGVRSGWLGLPLSRARSRQFGQCRLSPLSRL